MGDQVFFLRPANGEWIQFSNCSVKVAISRRLTRTIIHGGEGDDLIDEGSESAVYTVRGTLDLDQYKEVLLIFRGGQPYIHEPYEENEKKVVFSKFEFDGAAEPPRASQLESTSNAKEKHPAK